MNIIPDVVDEAYFIYSFRILLVLRVGGICMGIGTVENILLGVEACSNSEIGCLVGGLAKSECLPLRIDKFDVPLPQLLIPFIYMA